MHSTVSMLSVCFLLQKMPSHKQEQLIHWCRSLAQHGLSAEELAVPLLNVLSYSSGRTGMFSHNTPQNKSSSGSGNTALRTLGNTSRNPSSKSGFPQQHCGPAYTGRRVTCLSVMQVLTSQSPCAQGTLQDRHTLTVNLAVTL